MDPLWTYAELLARGWTPGRVRGALRSGHLVRLQRGVFTDVQPQGLLRARAALMHAPRASGSHQTAGLAYGMTVDAEHDVHLTAPHEAPLRPAPGVVVHRTTRPIPVTEVAGMRVTRADRTVIDLATSLPAVEAVCIADGALALGLCTREDLVAAAADSRRRPGAPAARRAVALSRIGAQSPMETRLRLLLMDGGLPEPVLQHPVHTARATLHLDLAWPEVRVAVEYDGRDAHAGDLAFARDRERWRLLAARGWDVHPVTAADLRVRGRLIAEVRAAMARRLVA